MKFKLKGKLYTAAQLTKPSVRDYLKLKVQTEELRPGGWTQTQVLALAEEVMSLPTDEARSEHPEIFFYIALSVWATLVTQGIPDAYDQALDLSLEDLEFIQEPEDHKAAAVPPKARARSARAGNRQPGPKPISETTT